MDTQFRRKYLALLFLFYLLCYILPLGTRNLAIPDETRYAEIPREMLAGGNWVSPHLDGVRYFEKPVLGYWAQAASIAALGENNFAVRLPSALSVGISACLLYFLAGQGRKQGSTFPEGTAAAAVFLSSFGVWGIGNTAVLDGLFSLLTTATLISLYFATEAPRASRKESVLLAAAGLLCGLAFMTKGFLAFAIPTLVAVPYLLYLRRYSDLLRMGLICGVVSVAVSLPWGIAIHLREPDFWNFFFWNEHIRRFMAHNAQHTQPFWFFFLALLPMALPWTFFLPAAARGLTGCIVEEGPRRRSTVFCLFWLIVPFVFLSLSRGKLATYILPCFPPLALLTMRGLSEGFAGKPGVAVRWGNAANVVLCVAVAVAFLYIQLRGFGKFPLYTHHWKVIMILNALICFLLFFSAVFRADGAGKIIFMTAAAPVFLFVAAHFLIPDVVAGSVMPGNFLEAHRNEITPDTLVISDRDLTAAACWYLKRDDIRVLGSPGELDYGLSWHSGQGKKLDVEEAVDLIRRHPGKVVLVAEARAVRKWEKQLPSPVEEVQSDGLGRWMWIRY